MDSCFYVWLNGRYIGYSQVSHATSEFDVTGVVEPGTNRLAVLVLNIERLVRRLYFMRHHESYY